MVVRRRLVLVEAGGGGGAVAGSVGVGGSLVGCCVGDLLGVARAASAGAGTGGDCQVVLRVRGVLCGVAEGFGIARGRRGSCA